MLQTYKAVLRGNRLEWHGAPLAARSNQPVAVHVTILEESEQLTDIRPGQEMADILEQLAAIHALADLTDPASWERNLRTERPLPERES